MSKKLMDRKNRFRNKIVSFRVSEHEWSTIQRKVLLSGRTKQSYIIDSILDKEINVEGNPFVIRSLHDELVRFSELYETLLDEDNKEMLAHVMYMLDAFTKEKANTKVGNSGARQ